MKLAILICATQAYTHAMHQQARRVQQCVALAKLRDCEGHVILSGDDSDELRAVATAYENLLPGWQVHHVVSVKDQAVPDVPHKSPKAKEEDKRKAFRLIADMREAAHARALELGVDYAWSLDSDVLPPPNALRSSFDALAFDGGYYSIAFCPYPNMLGLGGLGSLSNPIAEDFLPHERKIPARLRLVLERCEQRLQANPRLERELRRRVRLHQRAKQYPPDGNVWQVNGKYGWRPRGWLDHAYPAIGKGALLPSAWCGFGCTLMSAEALAQADFCGFRGEGTEDIFVIRNRWNAAGLRIGLLTHCPCDHVYMARDQNDQRTLTYLRYFHELEGPCAGHLRTEARAVAA